MMENLQERLAKIAKQKAEAAALQNVEKPEEPKEKSYMEELREKSAVLREKIEALSDEAKTNGELLKQAEMVLEDDEAVAILLKEEGAYNGLQAEVAATQAKLDEFDELKRKFETTERLIERNEEAEIEELKDKIRTAYDSFSPDDRGAKADELLKRYREEFQDPIKRQKMIEELRDESVIKSPEKFHERLTSLDKALLDIVNSEWEGLAEKLAEAEKISLEKAKGMISYQLVNKGFIATAIDRYGSMSLKGARGVISDLSVDQKKKFLQIIVEYFPVLQAETDRQDVLIAKGDVIGTFGNGAAIKNTEKLKLKRDRLGGIKYDLERLAGI